MKRLLKIIFIFLIFIPQGLIAQNNSVSINSENTVFQPPAVSASEVAKQLYYAKSIFKDSLVKSLKIVEQNLAVAINSGYQKEEALALNILGEFNMSLTNYPSAIRHLIKANQLYRQQSDKANTIITYDLLGDSYSKNKKSTLAIEQWLKAENLNSQSHANNRKKIEIQIKIGDEYLKISDFIKAKIYYEKALQLAEQTKNDNGIISATIGLGKVEERNGANAAAENLFQIANVKAVNSNSVELTNASLNSLSTLYQNSNNSVERIKIKEQAIDFNNTIGNTTQVIQNSTEMAEILLEDGKDDKAIEVLNQSAPLIQGQANSEAKRNFYKTLSKAYGEKGDIQKAKELEREYNVLLY